MHSVLPFRTKAAFHDLRHTAVAAGRRSLGSASEQSRAERDGMRREERESSAARGAAAGESSSEANSANANLRANANLIAYPNKYTSHR